MSFDVIERFKSSLIQHGKCSSRIYVMEFPTENIETYPQSLIQFARSKKYTKIICKTPSIFESLFLAYNFKKEALIPGFFNGKEDVVFMCYYCDKKRETETYIEKYEEIMKVAQKKARTPSFFKLPSGYKFVSCSVDMIPSLVKLYKRVFPSYPFPIHEPDYIEKTMKENITYYGVLFKDELVAAASTERSLQYNNCEMTDFATLPEYRGIGLGGYLLHLMDTNIKQEGICVVYTIARAISYGMNITFAKNQYMFGGRLKNNTDISGSIESMNIWYKRI